MSYITIRDFVETTPDVPTEKFEYDVSVLRSINKATVLSPYLGCSSVYVRSQIHQFLPISVINKSNRAVAQKILLTLLSVIRESTRIMLLSLCESKSEQQSDDFDALIELGKYLVKLGRVTNYTRAFNIARVVIGKISVQTARTIFPIFRQQFQTRASDECIDAPLRNADTASEPIILSKVFNVK